MVDNIPDPSHWVDRLSGALDELVKAMTAVRINLPPLTNSQYRDLAREADQNADVHLLFEEYLPKLDSDPAVAIGILQEHPIVRRESRVSTGKPAVMMLMPPGAAFRVELDRLVLYLTRLR